MITKEQIAVARDTLVKALTHPKKPIATLGLDLDGVIDEAAAFFAVLTKVWPGDVFIVTFRDDREKVLADLARFGIKYSDVVLVNSFAEKAKVVEQLAIDVFIDDQDECLSAIGAGTVVLKLRNGGNFDAAERKWLYTNATGRRV